MSRLGLYIGPDIWTSRRAESWTVSGGDVFLLVIRWLHLVTAAVWVGGSIFILLVLRPVVRSTPDAPKLLTAAAAGEFRGLVNLCIVVLVATGAVLALQRLTGGVVSTPYAITLLVKSALTVWMFLVVYFERRRSRSRALLPEPAEEAQGWLRRATSGYNAVVLLGLIVFGLSDLLKVLFEIALE